MFMIDYKDPGWRYWLLTALMLSWGILGNPIGFMLAMGLTVIQLLHFAIKERSLSSFPLQVRAWYLLLLLLASPASLQWIFWIPFIGTWAQVIFGYCTMARFVSLLPWNRLEPFSLKLLYKTFFSLPVQGSVKQNFSALEKP